MLVQEDQLSLAIGRRGQNVRLASKLVGWDIEIMTHDEYNDGIDRAERWFRNLPGITDEMVEDLIVEGFLSYTDLTFLDPAQLGELIGVDEEEADEMIACAEEWAEEAEEAGPAGGSRSPAGAGSREGSILGRSRAPRQRPRPSRRSKACSARTNRTEAPAEDPAHGGPGVRRCPASRADPAGESRRISGVNQCAWRLTSTWR